MKTTIGPFDTATRSVPVTFEQGEIVHERSVNACLDAGGDYDATATAARVAQVAMGVAAKIVLGVIQPAPEPIEPETPAQGDAPAGEEAAQDDPIEYTPVN